MRIRTGLGLRLGLATCCCAALAACTAGAPKGPDTTVTHAQRRPAAAARLGPGGAVRRGVHPLRRARHVQQRRAGARRVAIHPRRAVHERRRLSGRDHQRWHRPLQYLHRPRGPGFHAALGRLGIPRHRRRAAVRLPGPPGRRAHRPRPRGSTAGQPAERARGGTGRGRQVRHDHSGLRQRHPGRRAGRHQHAEQRHRQRRGARPGGEGRHPGLVRLHGEERLHLCPAAGRMGPGAAGHVRRTALDQLVNPGQRRPPTRRSSRRPSPTPAAPSPATWPGSTSPSRPATSSSSSTPTSRR